MAKASSASSQSMYRTSRPSTAAKGLRQQRSREFGRRNTLGATDMRQHEDDRARIGEFGDGRHCRAQPRIISDLAAFQRDIEVFANEYALAA